MQKKKKKKKSVIKYTAGEAAVAAEHLASAAVWHNILSSLCSVITLLWLNFDYILYSGILLLRIIPCCPYVHSSCIKNEKKEG